MHCSACGAGLNADARFCTQCGAKVSASSAESSDTEGTTQPAKQKHESRNKANEKPYRRIRSICIACLSLATLGLGAALMVPLLVGLGISFNQPEVSSTDVQAELSKEPLSASKQIEALHSQFPTFDDARWGQAKELITAWVDELGTNSIEKSKVIAEIKKISENFQPDQRTQAIDVYYRLKKDKLLSSGRSLQSWVIQFGTLSALFFSLLLIGLFTLVLMLIEIARHIKLRDADSS